MKQRLAKIHKEMGLPNFKPTHFGKATQKERKTVDVIHNRFFNGRFVCYKRVVLDRVHESRFSEKVHTLITFVDSDSDALTDNALNSAFEHFLKVHAGEVAKCEPKMQNKENARPGSAETHAAPAAASTAPAASAAAAAAATSSTDTTEGLAAIDPALLDVAELCHVGPPIPPPSMPKGRHLQAAPAGGAAATTKKGQAQGEARRWRGIVWQQGDEGHSPRERERLERRGLERG